MKAKLFVSMVVLTGLLFAGGCGTSIPIQEKYADQLSGVKMGMTPQDVKAYIPGIYYGGAQGNTTVYVLRDHQYAPSDTDANPWTGTIDKYLYFYFKDNHLVKWGRPGDWQNDIDIGVHTNK